MTKWAELGRMSFEQFEQFVRLHGGHAWKFKETIGDSVVSMMEGESQFVACRCDNIRLWCRPKAQPPVVPGGIDDENLVLTV
jgi:hypothetical protein